MDSGNSEIGQFRNSRNPQGLHSQARAIANKLTRPAHLEDISCDKQALHGLRAVGEVVSGSLRLGARILKRCCRAGCLAMPNSAERLVVQVVGLQHRNSEKGSGTAGNFGIPKIPKLS